MIILGIDPGFAIVGYGLIQEQGNTIQSLDYGVIQTDKSTPFPDRLIGIYNSLNQIIKIYHPHVMALEEIFFAKNTKTAINVAQARGVIMLSARINNLPIFEYRPNQVKIAVTGSGSAAKKQIQDIIALLLGLSCPPKPDDAADALAIAICHSNQNRVYGKIQG